MTQTFSHNALLNTTIMFFFTVRIVFCTNAGLMTQTFSHNALLNTTIMFFSVK